MSDANAPAPTETADAVVETAAAETETAPNLPENHPLVQAHEIVKAELKKAKQVNAALTVQESAARDQANQYAEQVTQLKAELVELRTQAENNEIAVKYRLSADDANVLASLNGDRDAKETLAQRLAAGYGVDGVVRDPLPVPQLGQVVTTDSDNATAFARFFDKLPKG